MEHFVRLIWPVLRHKVILQLRFYSLENHTVLRSRECILEGSRLHWSDRVLFDGKVYLTLEQTDTWTATVPQALDLKALWDQEVEHTRMGRLHLQEGCVKLMRELRLSEEQSGKFLSIPHLSCWTQLLIKCRLLLFCEHRYLRCVYKNITRRVTFVLASAWRKHDWAQCWIIMMSHH